MRRIVVTLTAVMLTFIILAEVVPYRYNPISHAWIKVEARACTEATAWPCP